MGTAKGKEEQQGPGSLSGEELGELDRGDECD